MVRTEGVLGLYTGLSPAVLRHIPYTGLRVLVFEQMRNQLQQRIYPEVAASGGARAALPLPANLALGLVAGALGQAAAVPADLVKVGQGWRVAGRVQSAVLGKQSGGLVLAAGMGIGGALHLFTVSVAHIPFFTGGLGSTPTSLLCWEQDKKTRPWLSAGQNAGGWAAGGSWPSSNT